MIDEAPRIQHKTVVRPATGLVDALRGTPTGFLVDAMGGSGALDYRIKPAIDEHAAFCGVALTCNAGPADNLALLARSSPCNPETCSSVPPATTPDAPSPAIWC